MKRNIGRVARYMTALFLALLLAGQLWATRPYTVTSLTVGENRVRVEYRLPGGGRGQRDVTSEYANRNSNGCLKPGARICEGLVLMPPRWWPIW